MDEALVITNPGADTEALDEALTVLRRAWKVQVARTEDREQLDEALNGIAKHEHRPVVVVAGGDGTMHAVIAALHDRGELADTVVGLLPLGTGNDFARGNGLPLEPAEAAEVVVGGRRRPMDLILDDDSVVVNSVHVGAGSEAARRGERWKERLGRIGYPIGALLVAVRPPALRLEVEVDDRVVHHSRIPVLQVAVGNGSQVGGGTSLVPDADPGDGRLDVVVSLPRGLGRLGYAAALVRGRHHRRRDVATARGSVVTVRGEEFWCSADGEITGPHRQRCWRVQPGAYTLLVPEESPASA